MSVEKVVGLRELAELAAEARKRGERVVLCHGTFDLMHAGHIKHLQRAREEGDCLFVTVTADRFVNKGPGRPVFGERLRAETLAALGCVDYVAINYEAAGTNVIESVRPDVYAKGGEYRSVEDDLTGKIVEERLSVERHGGRIFFTDEVTFSSTKLLNCFFDIFPEPTRLFLEDFRLRYEAAAVNAALKQLRGLRVAVVGDAIIDEYQYTTPLGQTGKGNALAVRYESQEYFAGGAIAVANHVAGFTESATLVSVLGAQNSFQSFIEEKLGPSVTPRLFMRDDDSTLVKRRFVDPDMAKLFEVYIHRDEPLPRAVERELCLWLDANLDGFDAVVVPDFGNGMVTDAVVEVLVARARFLAVNTQINSGNRGYHAITRYPRADFVSLNEPELRLATHSRSGRLEDLADHVAERLGCGALAVTRGAKGILAKDFATGEVTNIPALSTTVVDRIGAGDAFLSLAASGLATGLSLELAAFVGSVAAALEVQTVCNREPVDPIVLAKYVVTLLK